MTKGVKINYTEIELSFVKDNCTLPIQALHREFCKKFKRDDVITINLNSLRKRNGWKTGRTGCFNKGNVPVNKGVKGISYEGSKPTQFIKGHKPANHRPVGSIRVVDGYQELKVAEGMRQWKQLHRVIWERLNGSIPKGCNLVFLDGNKANTSIANLSVMSKADNMRRNSHYSNYPKEISQLIQLRGAINRQINKREKHEQHRHA